MNCVPATGIYLPMNGILVMPYQALHNDCLFFFFKGFFLSLSRVCSCDRNLSLSAKPLFSEHNCLPLISKLFLLQEFLLIHRIKMCMCYCF